MFDCFLVLHLYDRTKWKTRTTRSIIIRIVDLAFEKEENVCVYCADRIRFKKRAEKEGRNIEGNLFFCTPCNLNVHARTVKPDRIEKKFDLNRLWKQIFFLYRLLWKAKSNEACRYELWFLTINSRQVENVDSKSTITKSFFCLAGDPLYVGFDLTIASFDSISEVSMVSTNFE